MKLSEMVPGVEIADSRRDLIILGATDDSRQVRYGYAFFARPGLTVSGLDFIRQAVANGAQAVVVPEDTPDEAIALSDYERTKIAVIRHADVPGLYAHTLSRFYPERPERIAGVTGTNGKTSVVSFIKDLWAHAGREAMSLGTLGLRSKGRIHTDVEATLTTFDPGTLHLMLREISQTHRVSDLAMEVSSHALDQARADGLTYDVAGFTNLSQDHLDYHGTMEVYFQAKLRLFTELLKPDGMAVVNAGDGYGRRVIEAVQDTGKSLTTYSAGEAPADLRALSWQPEGAGQRIQAEFWGTAHEFHIPVTGTFQVENALCAIGCAVATGLTLEEALAGAEELEPIPGRAEKVATLKNGAHVFIDYAHTPDALERILKSLRPHVPEGARLRLLFGCGGDRDAQKRPLMGAAAAAHADAVYITDDNPRSEEATAIRKAVKEGAPEAVDAGARDEAVPAVLKEAGSEDIILIAGKGHEDYQILPAPTQDKPKATRKIRFSDREAILTAVKQLKL